MEAINSKELQGSDMKKNKKEINNHKKIAARLLETAELHLEIAQQKTIHKLLQLTIL